MTGSSKKKGGVLLNGAAKLDGLGGGHAAVDLNAQVHLVAGGFAVEPHGLGRVLDLVDVRLEIDHVALLVQEGREVADGGIALGARVGHALYQGFAGVAQDVVVDAAAVAHVSAEELVDGYFEVLAGNVPEGDVDGAERAHDRGAAEMAPAVHVLPVVLDPHRVLAHQVAAHFFDGGGGGFQEAPGAGLAQAHQAVVGMHLHQQVLVQEQRFDFGDLHECSRYAPGACIVRAKGGCGRLPMFGWQPKAAGRMQAQVLVSHAVETIQMETIELGDPGPGEVLVRHHVTAMSPGTERASLLQLPNIPTHGWPRNVGYSAVGEVVAAG